MTNHDRFRYGSPDSLLAESRAKWLAKNPEGWKTLKMDRDMELEVRNRMLWYKVKRPLKIIVCAVFAIFVVVMYRLEFQDKTQYIPPHWDLSSTEYIGPTGNNHAVYQSEFDWFGRRPHYWYQSDPDKGYPESEVR